MPLHAIDFTDIPFLNGDIFGDVSAGDILNAGEQIVLNQNGQPSTIGTPTTIYKTVPATTDNTIFWIVGSLVALLIIIYLFLKQ